MKQNDEKIMKIKEKVVKIKTSMLIKYVTFHFQRNFYGAKNLKLLVFFREKTFSHLAVN